MTNDVVEQLLRSRAINELHALLWAKPKVNQGEYDLGWSCREHAASIAALLTLRGVSVRLRHGRCAFVQGGTGNAPPVAITQQPALRPGHTWAWADGFGDMDVSPRLRIVIGRWRPLDAPFGVVGGIWPVASLPTDAFVLTSKMEYEYRFNEATHLRDAGRAVYLVQREEPFEPGILVDGATRLNSPLTARVIAAAGPAAYMKLIVHVRGLLAGQRKSLSTVSFGRAWQVIGEIPQDVADALIVDLNTALVSGPES